MNRKSTLDVGSPLLSRKAYLRLSPAYAFQVVTIHRDGVAPGYDFTKQDRLIESATAQPGAMEWNWHDQIRRNGRNELSEMVECQQRKRAAQMSFILVFEGMDHFPARAVIHKSRPGSVKVRATLNTWTTEMILTCARIRSSAECAERRNDQGHLFPTHRTDMNVTGVRYKGLTDVAEWWKNNIEDRNKKRLRHTSSETEVRIYHQYPYVGKARLTINDGGHAAKTVG